MKTKYLSLFLIAALTLSIAGCKKGSLDGGVSNTSYDVYVAGSIVSANNKIAAAYWKNGALIRLADSLTFSETRDIAVQGNDVYAVGDITSADYSTISAVYWKNGVETKLASTSNNAQAYGIAFLENDMYIVGGAFNSSMGAFQAMYWKNGVATVLSGGSIANAIAISGTDVYIAGVSGTGNDIKATYWKNGVATLLPGGLQANAIAVHGADVYVGGNMTNGAAGYWKNGVATQLTNSAVQNAAAYDVSGIALNGNDVYVSGSTFFISPADSLYANSYGSIATVWKNNVAVTLPANPLNNTAGGVSTDGANVYVSTEGVNNGPNDFVANYWINDKTVQLSSGGSKGASPGGIIVVPRQ